MPGQNVPAIVLHRSKSPLSDLIKNPIKHDGLFVLFKMRQIVSFPGKRKMPW